MPNDADEQQKLCYAKEVLRIISDVTPEISAPEIVAKITDIQRQYFGLTDNYSQIKKYFNELMFSKESFVENIIKSS